MSPAEYEFIELKNRFLKAVVYYDEKKDLQDTHEMQQNMQKTIEKILSRMNELWNNEMTDQEKQRNKF